MGNVMGGSAYAMSKQISEGYILVTERTFQRMKPQEMDKLSFQMEKLLREVRAEQPDLQDTKALQKRNRKMSRIRSALMMLRSYRARRKR
ncbi:MAG: hypothetical protein R3234_00955 [Thermoanaerobaculia bacterium]|nr:hypothetical protein [Thermoanaerobaculia bacterium]